MKSIHKYRRTILMIFLSTVLVLILLLVPRPILLVLWQTFLSQRLLIGLLLIFNLVALSLLFTSGQRVDEAIFIFFNLRSRRSQLLDFLMTLLTQIGSGWPVLLITAILYYLDYNRLAVELSLGTLTLWLTVETIKALADRSRPYLQLKETRIVGWKARGRSFPSGHTSQAFFLASFLLRYFQLDLAGAAGLYALAIIVGVTRIYVGVHYPRDVIGGALLGTGWGIIISLMDPLLAIRFPL